MIVAWQSNSNKNDIVSDEYKKHLIKKGGIVAAHTTTTFTIPLVKLKGGEDK